MPELTLNEQACTRCGLCVLACPWRILALPENNRPRYVDGGGDRCNSCGHCEAICPTGAVAVHSPRLDRTVYDDEAWEIQPQLLGAYLRRRRSIRHYLPEPVARAQIEQILDICRFAPTGRNRQDVAWLIIHDTREVRRLTAVAIDWLRSVAGTDSPFAARFDVPGMVHAWEQGRDPLCQQRTAPGYRSRSRQKSRCPDKYRNCLGVHGYRRTGLRPGDLLGRNFSVSHQSV